MKTHNIRHIYNSTQFRKLGLPKLKLEVGTNLKLAKICTK